MAVITTGFLVKNLKTCFKSSVTRHIIISANVIAAAIRISSVALNISNSVFGAGVCAEKRFYTITANPIGI
jgi:hypothetical protein